MKLLKKIKQTEMYQVFCVKAFEKSNKKVVWSYFICLLLIMWAWALIPRVTTDYKPLEQLESVKGTLIEITRKGKHHINVLVIITNKGKRVVFSDYLSLEKFTKIKKQLPAKIDIAYINEFVAWPLRDNSIVHLIVNNEIIRDYNKRLSWYKENSLSKKIIIFCLLLTSTILFRIWKKYK